MNVKIDTALGKFEFDAVIEADGVSYAVTSINPWNGEHGYETRMQRVMNLLAAQGWPNDGSKRTRELQAYTEGLIFGAHACFLALATLSNRLAATFGTVEGRLSEEDLEEIGSDDNKEAFALACERLHGHMLEEIKHLMHK